MDNNFGKLFEELFKRYDAYKKFIKKDKLNNEHYKIQTGIKYNDNLPTPIYHLFKINDKEDISLFFKHFEYYGDLFNDGKLYLILEQKHDCDFLDYLRTTYQKIIKEISHPYFSRIRENIIVITFLNNKWLEYKGSDTMQTLPPLKIN